MWHNQQLWLLSLLLVAFLGTQAAAKPAFTLNDDGTESIVNYDKYGDFSGWGTPEYRYYIKDREGLAKAVGEGIYPNVTSLLKDPSYEKMHYEKRLEGSDWDFVNSDNLQANFFKWAATHEQSAGIKEFYSAMMLEKAGLYTQAIKAYYAAVVHYPKAMGNTSWKTPWYVGPTALDSVAYLTRAHPELGMKLEGGRIRIRNRFDDDPHNDVFEIAPGRVLPLDKKAKSPGHVDLSALTVRRQLGHGRVHLTQYSNSHWQLFVDKTPYVVRGLSYSASPVGKSPDNGTLVVHRDWMISDDNKNGKIDGPYDSWVGKYRNDKLVAQGVDATAIDRVKAPAGLDLGAITPEEIAMSILAEITVERRRGQRIPSP